MCPLGAFVRVGSSLSSLTEKQIFDMYSKRTRTSLINIISSIKKLTFTQLKIYYEEIGYEINPNLYSQLNFKMENGEFNYLAYLLSDQNSLVINVGKFKGNDVYDLEELKSYSNQSLIKTTHEIVDYIESDDNLKNDFNVYDETISVVTRNRKKLTNEEKAEIVKALFGGD